MTEVMETGLLLFVCLEYVCVKIATLSILTFWTPTSSLGVGKHKAGHKTDVYIKKILINLQNVDLAEVSK